MSEAVPPPLDLSQPIVAQVGAMTEGYEAWVHGASSRKRARGSASARMFRGDWLESMSHIPWWLVLVVWVPIVCGLFAVGAAFFGQTAVESLVFGAVGLVSWTLVEYVLHRFVFHYKPNSTWGRKFHFIAHGVHHFDPWDKTRLVFPPMAGIAVALGIFGLASLAVSLPHAFPTMGGLLIGYIVYDMTHYYTHHAKPKSRLGKFLKAYHLAHHHKHWDAMYGVSSPLWDIVFRTGRP